MKNSIKVYEDPTKFIEVSNEDAEILTCKQMLNPINFEFTNFIFEHFEDKFFKDDLKKELFKIGRIFWNKYEKIPSEVQMNSILNNEKFSDKKSDYLKEYKKIISFKEEDYVDAYVKDILIKFTKMRKIYFTMLEQFEDIEERGDIGDCLSRFEKIVQLDMMGDLGIEYFSNLEKHCNDLLSIEKRQQFGFEELDRTTYGGMPTDDTCLFVVMAQPGLGKSQFMMNIAYNWIMAGKNVLMVSLEMSEDMYSRRMDGLFADINVNKLRENVGMLKLKVKQIKSSLPQTQLRIKEFPTGTCTAAMLKQYLKKLKANGFEPDLICVDYLNIMKPNGSASNIGLYEKGARIAEELRALSGELKKPVLTAIQSNRSSTGGGYSGADIDMSNAAESAGIPATADAMIALYQLEGERENGVINVKILKNRLGGYVGNTFKLSVNYDTLKITNMAFDDDINDTEGVFVNSQDANNDIFENSTTISNSVTLKNKNGLEEL